MSKRPSTRKDRGRSGSPCAGEPKGLWSPGRRRAPGEEGFGLIGLVVAIFLILLALSVAAPRVARSLRREQEVETQRRANQYVRAIQLHYRKLGHYPASMEQLEKSNNIRFLRQKYVDPMTGKDDWKLIHVGEQKTTVKGFFGKPLAGIASAGLGSLAGQASAGGVGTPAGALGASTGLNSAGSSGSGFGLGTSGAGGAAGASSGSGFSLGTSGVSVGAAGGGGATAGPGATAAGGGPAAAGGAAGAGFGSSPGADSAGGGGPFLGVGVPREGGSILTVNEQTTYDAWEFLYDPRIEQLRGRVNLLGGGGAGATAGGLGTLGSQQSGFGGSGTGAAGTGGASTFGAGPGLGAGPGAAAGPGAGSGTTTPPQQPAGGTAPPQ